MGGKTQPLQRAAAGPVDEGVVLDMLFVDPPSGGRGIAKLLIAFALDHARAAGHAVVRTRSSRTARGVFERSGFVVDAENEETRLHGHHLPNFDMHIDLA